MPLPVIFCPDCNSLILEAKECPACHWQRPVVMGRVGQPEWEIALEAQLPSKNSHPVAAHGCTYFATDSGQIIAVDIEAKGAIKWRHNLDPRYRCHGVAVWQDTLLPGLEYSGGFPTPPINLTVLAASDAHQIWSHPVDGASLSVPLIQDDTAYLATNSGWLYAINLANQTEMWREKLADSWSPAPPLLTLTGLLVLPGRSETLTAIDLKTREVAWTFSAKGWLPHSPVWVDGVLYLRSWDRHVYALDAASGRRIWSFEAARDFSSELCVSGDYLYIGAKDRRADGSRAYALYTLNRHSGKQIGRYEVAGHIFARPIAHESAVYFATDDRSSTIKSRGTLIALEATGQELLWEPLEVEQRFQSDLLLAGDLIVAGTRQGAVYAVRWREADRVESPQTYLDRQEWENAAIAYALTGEFIAAAELYREKLSRPIEAARLLWQAGQLQPALALLGVQTSPPARRLAIEIAQSLPEAAARAAALQNLDEHLAAAAAFEEAEQWLQAGLCFEAAQAWDEARAAYEKAGAEDRWTALTRKLELWDELTERMLSRGDFAQAAQVFEETGRFLRAAKNYDRANLPEKAFNAYRRVDPERLTDEELDRLAALAAELGRAQVAIATNLRLNNLAQAAQLAEAAGYNHQALGLYQQLGERHKQAEIYERLSQFAKAAEIFRQIKQEGRAAENLEKQVNLEIERLGGLRYAHHHQQIEAWLRQAIDLFEEEANFAETAERQQYFLTCAERCRTKLTTIRREPLLLVELFTEKLVAGQSSVVSCLVQNVGWGTARNPVLQVSSRELEYQIEALPLNTLPRGKQFKEEFTVVPKVSGAITVYLQATGTSRLGEPRDFRIDGGPTQILRATDAKRRKPRTSSQTDLGKLWEEPVPASSSGGDSSDVISDTELRRQRVAALKRQLAQHYANLSMLEDQAAIYGAGMAPLEIKNRINREKEEIELLERRIAELESGL